MSETMNKNPLNSVVPENQDDADSESDGANDRETVKKRMTMHVPEELAERIKNAVYWTPGLTISDVATEALRRVIDELEEEKNDGEPFPSREQELKGGRPLK